MGESVSEETARDAIQEACVRELEALKPGNVHVHADGHHMTVDDFHTSASIVAAHLSRRGLALGEKLLSAVEDSVAEVGCNTNLGIVLLCAPLAQAALAKGEEGTLRERLGRVLRSLSVDDASYVYKAIRIASPAGLGTSDEHDVASEPTVELVKDMIRGADVMVPMAIPTFGGMMLAILTVFGVPVLYCTIAEISIKFSSAERS